MSDLLEAALRRHRAWSIVALVVLTGLAWGWLLSGAGMGMGAFASLLPPLAEKGAMAGMAMSDMPMDGSQAWRMAHLALTFSMWWTMMMAMMLPSAAPTILLYARSAASGAAPFRPATASFLAGYLAAWGGFSLLATVLHAGLEGFGLVDAMGMSSQNRRLTALILIAVGLYQLTPIKDLCLRHCRNPAQFLSRHYRPGAGGALRMGLIHGAYCVGCCWVLMALLFVGGVMNLAWIAMLALIVAIEKLAPRGRMVAAVAGWLCLVWGLAMEVL